MKKEAIDFKFQANDVVMIRPSFFKVIGVRRSDYSASPFYTIKIGDHNVEIQEDMLMSVPKEKEV